MNLIEGTPVGQGNSPQPAENPNSVGSAFAVLNPPMSALVPKPADVPKVWSPAVEQIPAPDLTHPRFAPSCGVVTVTNELWVPKSARAVPPSVTNRLGMFLSAKWSILYNESNDARRHHRWALVTSRGPVIILCGISPEDRPANPCDFPPCVLGGLISEVAEHMMIEANTPRCQFARVPKEWTVVVRRADRVGQDGGA